MNLLCNEIIDLLSAHDYGYDVSIVRAFNAENKSFPRIVVRQLTDITLINTVEEQKVCGIAFQFEIYTRDTQVTKTIVDEDTGESSSVTEVVSAVEICDDLTSQIDELIWNQYKFNRDDVTEIAGHSTGTVYRYLRYSGAIEDNYTYRSSSVPYRGYTYQNNY